MPKLKDTNRPQGRMHYSNALSHTLTTDKYHLVYNKMTIQLDLRRIFYLTNWVVNTIWSRWSMGQRGLLPPFVIKKEGYWKPPPLLPPEEFSPLWFSERVGPGGWPIKSLHYQSCYFHKLWALKNGVFFLFSLYIEKKWRI